MSTTPKYCADPHGRYPIDNPEHIRKTAAALASTPVPEPYWCALTLTAAQAHGIEADVAAVLPLAKAAAVHPEHCGLVTADGRAVLPMRHPDEVRCTAAHVLNNTQLSLRDRQKIASQVLARAEKLGVEWADDIEHDLQQVAGYGTCLPQNIKTALELRAAALPAVMATALRKRAAAINGVQPPSVTRKLAALLDEIDRSYGLDRDYGTSLARPEHALCCVTKTATKQAMRSIARTVDGVAYSHDSLQKISADAIGSWLGEDVRADVVDPLHGKLSVYKLAAVLPTLPRPDAARFHACAAACKVAPLP